MSGAGLWILHDYLQVAGGAERLVTTLARGLPGARLGVSGIYPDFLAGASLDGLETAVLGGWTQRLPRIPRALATFAARRPEIADAETVLYSGIYTPLAVTSQQAGRRIAYCHTPPRFAFDRIEEYLDRAPRAARGALRHAIGVYRDRYVRAMRRMDRILTNSAHVAARIEAQTGLTADVVYPPVGRRFRWLGQGDYYLSIGRLEPNKRISLVVEAFRRLPDKKLIVVSGGSQLAAIRAQAAGHANIEVRGWVPDAELEHLVGHAIACIYIPRDEDFGMSAVEAMAAGKPVITVDEGGLRESVVPGRCGVLLPPDPGVDDLCGAVAGLPHDAARAMRKGCEAEARRFSESAFLASMTDALGTAAPCLKGAGPPL